MATILVKTFTLGKDDELNHWLKEHQHQLVDKGGPYPLDASGKVWVMYDGDKIKVEAPKEIKVTEAQVVPERGKINPTAIISMLKNKRSEVIENRMKAELELRTLPNVIGDKGQPNHAAIADAKRVIRNQKQSLAQIDKLIEDLENGKMEEILAYDPMKPEIIVNSK